MMMLTAIINLILGNVWVWSSKQCDSTSTPVRSQTTDYVLHFTFGVATLHRYDCVIPYILKIHTTLLCMLAPLQEPTSLMLPLYQTARFYVVLSDIALVILIVQLCYLVYLFVSSCQADLLQHLTDLSLYRPLT